MDRQTILVIAFAILYLIALSVAIKKWINATEELDIAKLEFKRENQALKKENQGLKKEAKLLQQKHEKLKQSDLEKFSLMLSKDKEIEALKAENERLRTIRVKLTAYSPFDNQSGIEGGGITSTGKIPSKKYCAADPKKIPYGTILEIPEYGEVEVQDTGSALEKYNGLQVDLYCDTYQETVKFGVQFKDIKIKRWGRRCLRL